MWVIWKLTGHTNAGTTKPARGNLKAWSLKNIKGTRNPKIKFVSDERELVGE